MTAPSASGSAASSSERGVRDLPTLGDESGDRPSVTDVNGTVARFEMTVNLGAGDRHRFGPPLLVRLPSVVFLGFGLSLVGMVIAARLSSGSSRLFEWLVEGDRHRPVSALALALIVVLCAAGTVVRAAMRGVVVHRDGVEARYLLAMGIPKLRRWAWAQIHRMIVDDESVMFELWNGEYEKLPPVAEFSKMVELLGGIAAARKIQVTRLGER